MSDTQTENGRFQGRNIVILLLALGLFFGGLMPLIIQADPFGWRIIDRLAGTYDPVLEAVPAETAVYLSLDLSNRNAPRTDDLLQTFAAVLSNGKNLAETQVGLNQQLLETANITLNDISPWVGRHVALAALDVSLAADGALSFPRWVIIAQQQDGRAADAFVAQLENVVGVREGDLVLVGSDEAALAAVQNSENSLRESADFVAASFELPTGRLLSGYLAGTAVPRLTENIPNPTVAGFPLPIAWPSNIYRGIGLGLTVVPEGVQLNTNFVYNLDSMTEAQQRSLETLLPATTADTLYPPETILLLRGQPFRDTWPLLRAALAGGDEVAFAESLTLLEEQVGVNPDTALFPLLDGEASLALLPTPKGGAAPVTFLWTSEPDEVAAQVEQLVAASKRPFIGNFFSLTPNKTAAQGNLYDVSTVLLPDLALSLGTLDSYFVATTDSTTLGALPTATDSSLAANPRHQQAWASLDHDLVPVWYADGEKLAAYLAEIEPLSSLAPWLAVAETAVSGSEKEFNVVRNTTIFAIP